VNDQPDVRADRVCQIADALYGRALDRNIEIMYIEIPSDLSGAAASMAGLAPSIVGKA
jgi:hypothetical protein